MFSRIERLPEKKLVGRSLQMSLLENRTYELWNGFMTMRKKITDQMGQHLFSMQVYDPSLDFKNFNPKTIFTKWAAIEVNDFGVIPETLHPYILKGGLYAIFIHKGPSSSFPKTAQYIFGQWLPDSEYELDSREHFELLREHYKPNDSTTEEEVWIPIKLKNAQK